MQRQHFLLLLPSRRHTNHYFNCTRAWTSQFSMKTKINKQPTAAIKNEQPEGNIYVVVDI